MPLQVVDYYYRKVNNVTGRKFLLQKFPVKEGQKLLFQNTKEINATEGNSTNEISVQDGYVQEFA
jgi:hypothetical protein